MHPGPWFVAPRQAWSAAEIELPADEARHVVRVLRMSPPDLITITDGMGRVARCALARVDGERVVAEVLEVEEHPAPRPELVVYQGLAKGRKLDDVVERLAELGTAEMHGFDSRRSVVRWSGDKAAKALDRWEAIARAAAKQSRSPFLMQLGALSFDDLVARVEAESFTIVLWEEATLPLRAALVEGVPRVALVVGPEGGLERAEAEALAEAGGQLVSLGPRILRTEVAPVVAASILLWHGGAIG